MAARPNSQRTLEYGHRLATNHLERLDEMMRMTQRAIDENRLLSADDIAGYKACLRAGKKQRTQFLKVLAVALPEVNTSTTRRKRGRPSNAELKALEAARASKTTRAPKAKAAVSVPTPKAEVAPPAPKKRGRPKGTKNKPKVVAAAPETVVADTPVKRKRGRPKGSKNKPKSTNGASAAATASAPVKRKRGRPKGSKNKPKAAVAA